MESDRRPPDLREGAGTFVEIQAVVVEYLSRVILGRRKLILGIIGIVTVIFAAALLRLRIVTDFEAFLLPDDPDLTSYAELKAHFGSDEFVLVAYETKDGVFTEQALKDIAAMTKRIEATPFTAITLSLTNAREFVATKDGIPVGMPIVSNALSLTKLDAAIVKAKIEENPFYNGLLVSKDEMTAFFVVQMKEASKVRLPVTEEPSFLEKTWKLIHGGRDVANFVRLDMTRAIEEAVAPYNTEGQVHLAGTPVYLTEIYRLVLSNMFMLGAIASVLVISLLWFAMRSVTGMVLPLVILVFSVIWNMGIFGVVGAPITIASSVVVPLIVCISVTNSVHFLLAYMNFLDENTGHQDALNKAMHHIIPPAFYSSLTTSAGFLTLVTARVLPVVQTGLYTAVGVFASFVLTITIIPIILSYFPKAPSMLPSKKEGGDDILVRLLDRAADINLRRPILLSVVWLGVAAGAVAALGLVRVETNPLAFFKKGSKMAQTHQYFEEKLGGTMPFEVIVTGKPGDFKELANYANLGRLENYLESLELLHGVVGTPDLLKEVHNALSDDGRRLPYDHSTFTGEVRLVDLARNHYPPINQLIDRQWSQARFTSRMQSMSSTDLAWLSRRIHTYAEQKLDDRFHYEVTGIVKLMTNMIDKVRDSQIASLSLAVILLWMCFVVFLRSALLGTLAMVPNIIPILVTLGMMGITKIELDIATIMMPSIAIGLAVDDTLHFFATWRARVEQYGDTGPAAIRWTMHFRGRAFIYTSVVLAVGFGVLLLSDLRPVADFGIISGAAISSALFADLLLNPALLRLAKPKFARWPEEELK